MVTRIAAIIVMTGIGTGVVTGITTKGMQRMGMLADTGRSAAACAWQ
jgi:hypothetical protein